MQEGHNRRTCKKITTSVSSPKIEAETHGDVPPLATAVSTALSTSLATALATALSTTLPTALPTALSTTLPTALATALSTTLPKIEAENHGDVTPSEKDMSRECPTCKETKSIDNFYKSKRSVRSECKSCHSRRTLKTLVPRQALGKERQRNAMMERGECADCKIVVTEETHAMFHWDHRNPADKKCNVTHLLGNKDETFYNEVSKCDLVCVNCHAQRTAKQHRDGAIKLGRPRKYHI